MSSWNDLPQNTILLLYKMFSLLYSIYSYSVLSNYPLQALWSVNVDFTTGDEDKMNYSKDSSRAQTFTSKVKNHKSEKQNKFKLKQFILETKKRKIYQGNFASINYRRKPQNSHKLYRRNIFRKQLEFVWIIHTFIFVSSGHFDEPQSLTSLLMAFTKQQDRFILLS